MRNYYSVLALYNLLSWPVTQGLSKVNPSFLRRQEPRVHHNKDVLDSRFCGNDDLERKAVASDFGKALPVTARFADRLPAVSKDSGLTPAAASTTPALRFAKTQAATYSPCASPLPPRPAKTTSTPEPCVANPGTCGIYTLRAEPRHRGG